MADSSNQSGLTGIYNSKVVHAEHVTRSMGSSGGKNVPFVDHHGVRVTTDTGNQYLVHKGPDYGRSSDTVVTPASNMSSNWQTRDSTSVSGKTVGDFVHAGKSDSRYNVMSSNCIHAANSMMREAKK